MSTSDLLCEDRSSGVRVVTLNRPERLNALGLGLQTALRRALSLDESDGVRCIVIQAAGRAFSVGADLKEPAVHSADQLSGVLDMFFPGKDIAPPCRVPVVAAVHGYCCGGGWELALAADICLATEDSKFWFPQTGLGLFPGAGGTGRLVKAVGKPNAMDIILSGRTVSGSEGFRLGLVSRLFPDQEAVWEGAHSLAEEIASKSPLGVMMAKQSILRALDRPIGEALLEDNLRLYALYGSQDRKEASAAFIEGRSPVWSGG